MTPLLRKLHKWVGLIVGMQFLLWVGSGLVMSLFDHHMVSGQHHRAPAPAPRAWPTGLRSPAEVLAAAGKPADLLETAWLGDKPAYRLTGDGKTWLMDATNGRALDVTSSDILAAARADYLGDGAPVRPVLLQDPGMEARRHTGPIWRVDFLDEDGTSLYLSGIDGKVLERRNDTWRLFDIAWMLHIMDYTGRQDFNHPLIVIAATGGLWMALSGVWLLVVTVRLREFIPKRWLPAREINVVDEHGSQLATVRSFEGDTVYSALARAGMQLPSNCGGGQSCGLCEVRACHKPPPASSADSEHIAPARLRLGHRLACNLAVRGNMRIAVTGGKAILAKSRATVESVNAVTPYLREIVLLPETAPGPEFRPGSYVQLHIPRYSFGVERLHLPGEHREEWDRLALPATLHSKEPVRRSYSLAMPVTRADGRLHLLVRFSPGRDDRGEPPGKASSFIYSLKAGDQVMFNGPFGEFALRHGRAEKIFVGGGAGMAPLRAMVHALLEGGASESIQFWYGARNEREVPYAEEMASLAQQYTNFSWATVYSDSAIADHAMVHEAVHRELLKRRDKVRDCEFYVCGPPAMLAATRQMLAALGARKVAFDDFKI
jgi:Na(+)-translocating NADH:ubiquinone oxidoreductase F subunit